MGEKLTLTDRLLARLKKLGVTDRKAKELAKGLVPTAAKAPVSGTVTLKLTNRLIKLGLSERKATELAKGLAPTVRTAIKAKAKTAKKKLTEVDDALVEETVAESVDSAEDAELDKVAPRVDGHRLRLDLPTASYTGGTGLELLRVMDGLTTQRTYLSAAVKSDVGIVAIRKMDSFSYKVKFYPTMAYWNRDADMLTEQFGATGYLQRQWYERMFFTEQQMSALLGQLAEEAKPKSRMKALLDRFRSVSGAVIVKAFTMIKPVYESSSMYMSH